MFLPYKHCIAIDASFVSLGNKAHRRTEVGAQSERGGGNNAKMTGK